MIFEEFINRESEHGLKDELSGDPFKRYTFDDLRKIIDEHFEKYINELREQDHRAKKNKPSLRPDGDIFYPDMTRTDVSVKKMVEKTKYSYEYENKGWEISTSVCGRQPL